MGDSGLVDTDDQAVGGCRVDVVGEIVGEEAGTRGKDDSDVTDTVDGLSKTDEEGTDKGNDVEEDNVRCDSRRDEEEADANSGVDANDIDVDGFEKVDVECNKVGEVEFIDETDVATVDNKVDMFNVVDSDRMVAVTDTSSVVE